LSGEGQAQAGTRLTAHFGPIAAEEAGEQTGLLLLGQAVAGVGDADVQPVRLPLTAAGGRREVFAFEPS
jgi:hypothetical protein